MAQLNEKLLFLKERYLILADYDMLSAEMLSIIDQKEEVSLTYTDFLDRMVFKASIPTLRSRLESLERKKYILRTRSKPNKYRVTDQFREAVSELGMIEVEKVELPIDYLVRLMAVSYNPHIPEEIVEEVTQSPEVEEVVEDEPQEEKEPKARKKIYTWEHYAQISTEEWKSARSGVFPNKETAVTLILGAYLLGMKRKHNMEIGLASQDFGGKYGKLAKEMLSFFSLLHDGDDILGFNTALEWVKEFVHAPSDSFAGKAGWPIQMAFSRDMYRQNGTGQFSPKQGKKRNDTGVVVMDQKEREEATVRIGKNGA